MDFDSDGVRLHYEQEGPAGGKPIVLVHGFASDYHLNWVGTRWQQTLVDAGFRVIGLDCRGHGHSDKPHDPAAYALKTMAADVRRLLDHLELQTADYLGFSMGGRIGIQAVVDMPDRLGRAVLGGVGMVGAVDDAEQIARAFRGERAETPIALSFYEFASARPINDLEALANCVLGQQPNISPAQLVAVRTPVLVVVGDKDQIARNAPELVGLIPTARLVTIPGRDHLGTVPAREFKAAALEFLETAS